MIRRRMQVKPQHPVQVYRLTNWWALLTFPRRKFHHIVHLKCIRALHPLMSLAYCLQVSNLGGVIHIPDLLILALKVGHQGLVAAGLEEQDWLSQLRVPKFLVGCGIGITMKAPSLWGSECFGLGGSVDISICFDNYVLTLYLSSYLL